MNDELTTTLCRAGYTLIETHISRVFLGDDHVYKIKRPVALGFLDFTSLAAREHACLEEVRLNRRLAADVYLGVRAVVRDEHGRLVLRPREGCQGAEVVEWAVHMRRLDDAVRADRLLAEDRLTNDDLDAIAGLLVAFHRDARADAETARFGTPEVISTNVEENFAQVEGSIGDYLDTSEQAALADYERHFLRDHRALLARRAARGRVRDGHGDLRLEHLYRRSEGRFSAIDCIEFNERFRYADVCADLAFLTMDLTYHGRSDLAELLLARYARDSGDYELYALRDFYESYRAVVRAKVASFLAADPDVGAEVRARARDEARHYYLLALAAGRRPLVPARIIVSFGLIGSGKTALAEALGKALALPVLSSDWTRKELLGSAPTAAHHDDAFHGAYTPEMSDRVYATVLERAEHVLRAGRGVVLDGTFGARARRDQVRSLAAALRVPVTFLECRCTREETMRRLTRRAEQPSLSDGRAAIYDSVSARFEPPEELSPELHQVIDTSGSREESTACALARVRDL